MPIFKYTQENDKFTVIGAATGNKALTHPIGLITSDEVVAAGSGKYNTASSYYLKRALSYWSLSPQRFYSNILPGIFVVHNTGQLNVNGSIVNNAVAPVINLASEYAASLVGTGEIDSPYHLPNEL